MFWTNFVEEIKAHIVCSVTCNLVSKVVLFMR